MFTECFDAKKKFKSKNVMVKIDPSDIGRNDLVLVECNIARYKCNERGMAIYKGAWERWRAAFELLSVSLLSIGPESTPDAAVRAYENDPEI